MSTQGHEKEAVNVEGLKAALKSSGNKAIYNEAICSTAGGTAAKVTNTVPPSFSLVSGAKILIKFTYAITVANATLQVGTNAAKPIFYHGAALAANLVKAGTSLLLVYDGTNFNIVGDINTDTTYQVMGASGANHASGLVPDTPSVAGTTKFLREDGTWQEPAATKLQTARTIWGHSFDGTGNVSGFMKNVTGLICGSSLNDDWSDGNNTHPWYGIDYRHCVDSSDAGKAYSSIASFFGLFLKTSHDKYIILDTGRVGIGTTNPSKKLDVNGTLNVSGDATLTSINGVTVGSSPKFTDTTYSPQSLGSGIGTCSTSSGTALVVSLTGYELVQNGFVAVSFEHDVPASATLNINGKGVKPIIYKSSAIEADVIKADDTALFSYNGTNYVLISSGGGAAPVNPNETVNISLTQIGGNSADLTGASITITDDDSRDTLYTGTWAGTMLTTEIGVNTNYTVSVDTITGYVACAPQSYTAQYQTERNVSFKYIAPGAYIEATDHSLYTSSSWGSSGKTANCVVLITSTLKRRISLVATRIDPISTATITSPLSNYISPESYESALLDYDGSDNTEKMVAFSRANSTYNQQTVAPYCDMYTFPDGVTKAYMPAMGEAHTIGINYYTQIEPCLEACNGNLLTRVSGIADIAASSASTSVANNIWTCRITASGVGSSYMGKGEPCYALPIAVYE